MASLEVVIAKVQPNTEGSIEDINWASSDFVILGVDFRDDYHRRQDLGGRRSFGVSRSSDQIRIVCPALDTYV